MKGTNLDSIGLCRHLACAHKPPVHFGHEPGGSVSYEVPKAEGLGALGIALWVVGAAILVGSIAGLIDLVRWLI
jgi:hypothetical protein